MSNLLVVLAYSLYAVLLLFGLMLLGIYIVFDTISGFLGAPYVATRGKTVKEILEKAKLKKGQVFLELGSGDGRVVRTAVKKYGVKGIGVEFHPILIWYSRLLAKLFGVSGVEFVRGNFYQTDLSKADVIYMFLLPKTMEKLREKILRECKKGTLLISHGFKIRGLERFLILEIPRKTFSTFYYRIR